MVYEKSINGKYINLESVDEKDAEFTSMLRSDEKLIKYVHKVDTTISSQKKYIRYQRQKMNDYYFLISDIDNKPLGTIALYNFKNNSAELGRWISYGNAFQNLESIVLVHNFAFNILGFESVYTCTDVRNERVKNFWKNFGSDELFIEEQQDFTASKNIINRCTFEETIRPKMLEILRY